MTLYDSIMTANCLLCQKLSRLNDLPGDEIVWEFPHSVAFLGPWQYYAGYCVLVSRRHATELHLLPGPERQEFLNEMVVVAQAIEVAFKPRKMNYEILGNHVPHLHWHLFPRSSDDPENLKAVWLALERADNDQKEKTRLQTAPLGRKDIIARLRTTLGELHAPTP